ncbi:YbaK/EbsC family protein [Kineococcus glutinatus]|uniref:YbaK/EbsC family protein n=1 Tax=Kineococcus glutinatus TaxID=1070872 RepID=UPI003CD0967C
MTATAQPEPVDGPAPLHRNVAHVQRALHERGCDAEVRVLADAVRTAAEAAAALGVEVGAIANSLVFLLDTGDGAGTGTEPLLVLTSGAHRVEEDVLGPALGGVLRRASAAQVRAATGQPIGGVSPVGHPAPLRTVVDEQLRRHPRVWAAAGHPHAVFSTTHDELVALTGGTSVPVAADG